VKWNRLIINISIVQLCKLPLFCATCIYSHQILSYGRLFLSFINTNVVFL